MRIPLVLVVFFCSAQHLSAQQLMLPKDSKIYPDSIAIFWKDFSKRSTTSTVNIKIESSWGENFFDVTTTDSVLIAPYYLLYDNEAVLYIFLTEPKNRRSRYLEQVARVMPMKKVDSLESLIYKTLETPNEENYVELAKMYERTDCFINAMFVYHKLYLLGFKKYWEDFTRKRLTPIPGQPNILR